MRPSHPCLSVVTCAEAQPPWALSDGHWARMGAVLGVAREGVWVLQAGMLAD